MYDTALSGRCFMYDTALSDGCFMYDTALSVYDCAHSILAEKSRSNYRGSDCNYIEGDSERIGVPPS